MACFIVASGVAVARARDWADDAGARLGPPGRAGPGRCRVEDEKETVLTPGVRITAYDNQKPPYELKAVPPNVLPHAYSHIPAWRMAMPWSESPVCALGPRA